MISLILPYWDRQQAADNAFALLASHYAGLDLEVIVVDDGNAVPYVVPDGMPFPVRVLLMPEKHVPKTTCTLFNRAAEMARGEYLALSCIEMLHQKPVLPEMLNAILSGDESTYVIAAVWAPDDRNGRGRWHVHSSMAYGAIVHGVQMPKGAHYHFLTMMTRALWDRTGGIDEDYRDGAGYDDADFVLRLQRAGARFVLRDDLVIEHPRSGARSAWTPEMFERNKQIFISKWSGHQAATA